MSVTTSGNNADRDQLKNAKIAVLRLINEHRDILFGKLSETLSREVKEAKWAEVAEHAHALGAFPSHRSWDYLKDTTWQNWRKRFVEKRDKKEKFEKYGIGMKVVYDEADMLINDILESLGRNGPSSQNAHSYTSPNNSHYRDISDVLEIEFDAKNEDGDDGLNLSNEIFQSNHQVIMSEVDNGSGSSAGSNYSSMNMDSNMENGDYSENGYDHEQEHDEDDHDLQQYIGGDVVNGFSSMKRETSHQPKIVSTSSLSSAGGSKGVIFRKYALAGARSGGGGTFVRKRPANFLSATSGSVMAKERDSKEELVQLKCKKIRAELELLERESYKKDLEILQLERSLGIPASHITQKFYNRANIVNRVVVKNR